MANIVVLTCLTPMLGDAQLAVTFDHPSQTATAGSTINFTGTVKNNGSTTIFLNGDGVSLKDITTDDSQFLAGVPASLAPGASYSGTLFTATLGTSILPADYKGSFSIFGGADANTYTSQSMSPVDVNIAPLQATATLQSLSATYDGSSHGVTATTNPPNLQVNFSYNGNASEPTEGGTYTVVGVIADPTYQGNITGTFVINPTTQTISLPPLTVLSYGSSPITLNELSSAGLPLSFTLVSGPASVSGWGNNILTLSGTGTVTLQASQAGDNDYLPATSVNQNFTVEMPVPFTGDPTATPFGDGVSNLFKYYYDINPSAPISATDRTALPTLGIDSTTTPGTQYLTLTYRQFALATGITVNIQVSFDLQNWTTVTPDLTQQVGADPTTGDPIMEVEVNTYGATQEFIRLDLTQ